MAATKLVFLGLLLAVYANVYHIPPGRILTITILFTSNLPQITEPKLNSSGHLIGATGFAPDLLALISSRWGFKYTWNERSLNLFIDDTQTKKGLISLLMNGEGDVILGAIVPTADRLKYIDFTAPNLAGAMRIMIPYPMQSSNSKAFVQPFEFSVWMGLLTSLVMIPLIWYVTAYFSRENKLKRKKLVNKYNSFKPVEYTTRIWLGQGDSLNSQLMGSSAYIIAGVCCLSAFFMVQAYNCNLLPLILAPLQKPLIRSVFDIANVPGLRVAVSRGLGADVRIQGVVRENANTSYTKAVVAFQKTMFRCNKTDECLQKVLFNNHVYIHGDSILYDNIMQSYISTGRCQFTLAEEFLYSGHLTWGIPKNNHLMRNIFNKGLLEMSAFGLNIYLQNRYIKKPTHCLKLDSKNVQKKPLGLDVLSVAFILLASGYAMSLVALIIERVIHVV